MERWRGRTALVTGASSGIGRAITINLLNHGLNVAACSRRVEMVQNITEEVNQSSAGKLKAIKCDLTKEEDILRMFQQINNSDFKGVDICINNAGRPATTFLSDGTTEEWRNILDLNVLAVAICSREALRSMRSRGVDDGHIINMSSILAHTVWPDQVMYSASKHAVKALTEGLRQELLANKSSIRVTEVCPEVVKTPLIAIVAGSEENAEAVMNARLHLLPNDASSVVEYVLSAPKHVQVHDVIFYPVCKSEQE